LTAKRSPRQLPQALRALVAALDRSGRPSMIIGGIAVIARGVPRLTRDIDATVAAAGTDLDALLEALAGKRIEPRIPDATAFARETQVLLLEHRPSGVEIDLSLAWLPFELEAIAAAEPITLHGAKARVARAEDLIVYKVVAWRPQDQQDVERLLALHAGSIDLGRVRRLVGELANAIEDPERVIQFEALLETTVDPGR
jgi:hypothetical protein